jgi:hypothetical protein
MEKLEISDNALQLEMAVEEKPMEIEQSPEKPMQIDSSEVFERKRPREAEPLCLDMPVVKRMRNDSISSMSSLQSFASSMPDSIDSFAGIL